MGGDDNDDDDDDDAAAAAAAAVPPCDIGAWGGAQVWVPHHLGGQLQTSVGSFRPDLGWAWAQSPGRGLRVGAWGRDVCDSLCAGVCVTV